ncbi:MAG TPA: polysaccharide biosynthesis protein, partial [Gemmatimonadales bacterium]|nr:polysaccharide biosynthesis protein [Gemmatimonadales bacterium]
MDEQSAYSFSTHLRNRYLFLSDVLLFSASVVLAFTIRFEGFDWGSDQHQSAFVFLLVSLPVKLLTLWAAGLYRRLWRYAGLLELERLIVTSAISGLAGLFIGAVVLPVTGLTHMRVPLSVLFLDGLLTGIFAAGPRLAVRSYGRRAQNSRLIGAKRALIVGAGSAGELIVKELLSHPHLGLNPIGFVDDDDSKHGHRMHNRLVLGPVSSLRDLVVQYEVDEVIIALPRASGQMVRQIVKAALEVGVNTRTIPALSDILSGRVAVGALRRVEIQDLLRREPIQTDLDQVRSLATGETVLITGAGGSIGSELCRQLARLEPAQIILLGHGENSIFDITAELTERHPTVTTVPIICDVRDRER